MFSNFATKNPISLIILYFILLPTSTLLLKQDTRNCKMWRELYIMEENEFEIALNDSP